MTNAIEAALDAAEAIANIVNERNKDNILGNRILPLMSCERFEELLPAAREALARAERIEKAARSVSDAYYQMAGAEEGSDTHAAGQSLEYCILELRIHLAGGVRAEIGGGEDV